MQTVYGAADHQPLYRSGQNLRKEVNFKSKLIEWSQKNKMEVSFELIEQFLDHDSNPVFQTEVRIEGLPAGTGTGYSKKESQQNAAQMAIKKVKDQAFMDTVNEVKAQHSMPPEAEAEALETKAEALEAEIAEPEVTDEIANDETGLQMKPRVLMIKLRLLMMKPGL